MNSLQKPVPLSVLDLAPIVDGGTAAQTFANSLSLARHAEQLGYRRFWLAEHHNMPGIASAATAVLIGHVAGGTSTIRVGAGGIMLPNHAPLQVAEQFGTLVSLYPGRIDLGVGRAPGTDQAATRAMRRYYQGAEEFPADVAELLGYFEPASPGQPVRAVPGEGVEIEAWILGSSLFGAGLAAAMGLPYAFASHFAPDALEQALELYRRQFRPSVRLQQPHVMLALNVVAADTEEAAREQLQAVKRTLAIGLFGRGQSLTDEQADQLLVQGAGQHVEGMLTHTAVGAPGQLADYVEDFRKLADADELIVAHQSSTVEGRLRSVELTAEAMQTVAA